MLGVFHSLTLLLICLVMLGTTQSRVLYHCPVLPTNITANVNYTFQDLGSLVSTVITLWASAMTLGPSTTRLKSGGREEVGVDPAGGQGDC